MKSVLPADGPVGDAVDKIKSGITGAAENPLLDAAHDLGMLDWSSGPVTEALAIILTKDVVKPVKSSDLTCCMRHFSVQARRSAARLP
jgi:hypothetical protein